MKAFIKNFDTGEFGEYYVTGDMNTTTDNCITFEVDSEEVYPELASRCNISVVSKVTANKDDVMFEDELLNKIIDDIGTEAKHIKDASDRIAQEEINDWSEDRLFMIDSRVEIINQHLKKLKSVLEIIYNS